VDGKLQHTVTFSGWGVTAHSYIQWMGSYSTQLHPVDGKLQHTVTPSGWGVTAHGWGCFCQDLVHTDIFGCTDTLYNCTVEPGHISRAVFICNVMRVATVSFH
jgi:hypothetical protein